MSELHDIRLIAMYLPQYHPIPENNKWWGEGFTEWTNVRKAEPRFPGHHQPQIPGELGYYDLRDPGARQAQADLAHEYGIHGFCYYHYWFNGKRLLETPFNEVLRTGKPDFPFCICWANENWSRRWDGSEHEILMAQHYSDEDSLDFINSLIPAFSDDRYIRVNGKPLLLLYRTGLLPDPKRTTEIWREAMLKAGIGDLYLVRVENFMHGPEPTPEEVGFDAAMEFAPYWGLVGRKMKEIGGVDLPEDVLAYSYDYSMKALLNRPVPSYKLFRGVFPGWDNSARRKTGPTLFLNSSPEKYAYWLSLSLKQTIQTFEGDERIVFINAWNEWGEGCHLEPDKQNGLSYLNATKLVLRQSEDLCKLFDNGKTLLETDDSVLNDWFKSLDKIYGEETGFREHDLCLLRAYANLLNTPKITSVDKEVAKQIDDLLKQKDVVISALYDSLSWRITAPLRKLYDRLFK